MIYDCHLHTAFSGDSQTPVRRQIEQAIRLGMEEMCITDHHDYDSSFCEDNFVLDVDNYLKTLESIRFEYRDRIRVNIGIELGLQCHLKEYLTRFVSEYGDALDFIIGSSHFVDRTDPYYPSFWEKKGERLGLTEFFKESLQRAEELNHVFDSYGHLDYVVRYAPHQNAFYTYEAFSQWIDPILQILIDHDRALECNTGGFKYGLEMPNPSMDVLKRYRELGGEKITIGSDAHSPEHIGFAFERCRQLLLDCGYRYFTVYRNRRAEMIPL